MPLIVWDFDLTITQIHTCRQCPDLDDYPIEKIIADPLIFQQTIYHLLQLGYQVAIASYGYQSVILALMQRLFGSSSPFTEENIVTPQSLSSVYAWREGFEPPTGMGKWLLLQILRDRFSLAEEEILLIDDSIVNCYEASQKGYKVKNIRMFNRDHGFSPDCSCHHQFHQHWNSFLLNA